jgi:hypothetical protein
MILILLLLIVIANLVRPLLTLYPIRKGGISSSTAALASLRLVLSYASYEAEIEYGEGGFLEKQRREVGLVVHLSVCSVLVVHIP